MFSVEVMACSSYYLALILSCLQEWIMEQWEKNFYISAVAGASNGSSLVVMSRGEVSVSGLIKCLVCTLYFYACSIQILKFQFRHTVLATIVQS